METAAIAVTLLIAAFHGYIAVMEMLLWETPRVRKVFNTTAAFATQSKVLAANQGLYNGFLVAGLLWGLWQGAAGRDVTLFFLACVAVAGVFGGLTVSRRIFLVQAVPALVAMMLFALA